MPAHARSSTQTSTTAPSTGAETTGHQSGPGNAARQERLRTGDGTTTSGELDTWGTAAAAEPVSSRPTCPRSRRANRHASQRDGAITWMQAALERLGFPNEQSGLFGQLRWLAHRSSASESARQGLRSLLAPGPGRGGERQLPAVPGERARHPGRPSASTCRISMQRCFVRTSTPTPARPSSSPRLAHESDGFNTLEEYASGRDYEGRTDLGNVHPGDGRRFKVADLSRSRSRELRNMARNSGSTSWRPGLVHAEWEAGSPLPTGPATTSIGRRPRAVQRCDRAHQRGTERRDGSTPPMAQGPADPPRLGIDPGGGVGQMRSPGIDPAVARRQRRATGPDRSGRSAASSSRGRRSQCRRSDRSRADCNLGSRRRFIRNSSPQPARHGMSLAPCSMHRKRSMRTGSARRSELPVSLPARPGPCGTRESSAAT